jgi:hypothetical protein
MYFEDFACKLVFKLFVFRTLHNMRFLKSKTKSLFMNTLRKIRRRGGVSPHTVYAVPTLSSIAGSCTLGKIPISR